MLRVVDLTTSLPGPGPDGRVCIVDHVSFDIQPGEILGLVGESGCGKSMTALSLMRLLPTKKAWIDGSVEFAGRDLLRLSEPEMRQLRGNDIAMVFQDPMSSLNPVIPIGTQIREVLRFHKGLDRRAAERRTIELLEMVKIPDARRRVHEYQHEFSGGMRQRVMIAMALSCEPRLLIADEATTALDVTIQAQILGLLKSLCSRLGTSIILITHDLGVVASVCDRVNVIYSGRVVESAGVDELFSSPRMPYSWGLLESLPRQTRARKTTLPVIEGGPPGLLDTSDRCRFSPRCRYVHEVCREREPHLSSRGGAHLARCWGTEESGWIGDCDE